MKAKKTDNKCRRIRTWLYELVCSRLSIEADWIQVHIASCPKCQRRLASVSKVNLALSIIKSHPHSLGLLMRANTKAVNVLKHSLRYSSKAQELKEALPEPSIFEKSRKYRSSIANAAVCFVILFLMKSGIFSYMQTFQSEGQKAVEIYYAHHLGDDLADEIFSA